MPEETAVVEVPVIEQEATQEASAEQEAGEQQETQQEGQQEQKNKGGGFQRRIDKLTKEKSEAAREAEYWRAQALKTQEAKPAAIPEADSEPDPNKFDTQADYIKALTKYNVNQAKREFEAEQRAAQSKAAQESQQKEFNQRLVEYKANVPDFDEVLASTDAVVTPAMNEEIMSHEHGPELVYFLAQNPDEAARLAQLSPVALARAVTRLEPKFVPQERTEAVAAPVSKAPKPPTPVSRSSKTVEKDPGEMNPREYAEWRAKTYPNL